MKFNRNTILISIANFFVDLSSEMVFPILPFFLTVILGAPLYSIGLMESMGALSIIAAALLARDTSLIGKKKQIIIVGYGISALFGISLALATFWQQIVVIRIIGRAGKGLRESPQDALIALSEPKELIVRAFGFRKMLDNMALIIGPLITSIIVILYFNNTTSPEPYYFLFVLGIIPACIAVFALVFLKDDKISTPENSFVKLKELLFNPVSQDLPRVIKSTIICEANHVSSLPTDLPSQTVCWRSSFNDATKRFFTSILILTAGRFSLIFFLLRAGQYMELYLVPIVYLTYNISYTLFASVAGKLAAAYGVKKILILGFSCLLIALLGFTFFPSVQIIFLMFFVLGVFMAIIETAPIVFLMKNTDPSNYPNTAATYKSMALLAEVPANIIAGLLWSVTFFTLPAAFVFSIITTLFAGFVLVGTKEKVI